MQNYIKIRTNISTAAWLLLTNDLDIHDADLLRYSSKIFDELLKFSPKTFLEIVDNHIDIKGISISECPDFGYVEKLQTVPEHIMKYGQSTSAQLGIYIKGHSNDSHGANRKFGENHGKTSALLSLVAYEEIPGEDDSIFFSTSFTKAYCERNDQEKREILRRLAFRLDCIKILLKESKEQKVNIYDFFIDGAKSTQTKKRQGINHMLDLIHELNSKEINARLENIYWEE